MLAYDEPDLGPIIFASVDAGLTVVHDASTIQNEMGGRTWPTAIPERVEFPEFEPALDIVRAPDDADAIPQFGAPMISDAPRVEAVERLTPAYVAALMRHKVEGRDGAPLGGGGGGRRRTKPPKRQPIRELVEDEKPGTSAIRFEIRGLTAGEWDFFERRAAAVRGGEMVRVLKETVGAIIRGEIEPLAKAVARFGPAQRYNGSVYAGDHDDELKEPELNILRNWRFRGAAKRALIQHAHMVDGPRVKAIDAR